MQDFERIIDSHTHWGPSITMGTSVSTEELIAQRGEAGITDVVIMPFPSTAIETNGINEKLLDETRRTPHFIPYFCIREDFSVIPQEYRGGKWHWMRGVQDASSNYRVLDDPGLPGFIELLTACRKPVLFEEELDFTRRFKEMAPDLTLIVPHCGMLGGNPEDFLQAFRHAPTVFFDTALAASATIVRFVRALGPERLIFGSDVPFGRMKSEVSKVLGLDLPYREKEMILSKNIARLAKLDE